jgi:dTDP-4-amino-4,6-dideoxygalactose transaminase
MAINVTESFLPPREEFDKYVDRIWESQHLTNGGSLLVEFEQKIKNYLSIDNFQFVANGTLALQLAIDGLGISSGEIITTPFSYVATTSAILWQRCKPVFTDIDKETFCIDASKIEASITKDTKAILAVHVFGNPCDVDKIEAIARKHKIKVIYDAAHAFGVTYKGKSILDYGDVSIISFHATKLFHTIEGGGLVAKSKEVRRSIDLKKRFGHNSDIHIVLGVNAKANEFQAAMGLSNLPYLPGIINARKTISDKYTKKLKESYQLLSLRSGAEYNSAYYPVIFKSETELLKSISSLNKLEIFPRRYFYPSLNTLPYLAELQNCPVSEDIANRIVCLPLYPGLEDDTIDTICGILLQ